MDQSTSLKDHLSSLMQNAIQHQIDVIRSRVEFLHVFDDKNQAEAFTYKLQVKEIPNEKTHVFDSANACCDYVTEEVSANPHVCIFIFVTIGSADELISYIHCCDQVRKIFIMTEFPSSHEQREAFKIYDKVVFMQDAPLDEMINRFSNLVPGGTTEQTHFTESITFENVDVNKNVEQPVEPIDRSCKQFDKDFTFRYGMLMLLLDAPPFSSDKNDLIELFKSENLASSSAIEDFQVNYLSNQAIFFYTKSGLVFETLNKALRAKNVRYLLLLRFILQDICNGLRDIMSQEKQDHTVIVYRGQQASSYEVGDLILACKQRCSITNVSFLSASKNRNVALGFLAATNIHSFDTNRKLILFTITARKSDAAHYFPFADISKLTQHPEEAEVLFTPGQIFIINDLKIIIENDVPIYSFEMSLDHGFEKRFTNFYSQFTNLWIKQINDSLLFFAKWLLNYERIDEAKDLYKQLLSQFHDKNKKSACYEGLVDVAMRQNDIQEAKMYQQKVFEIKFGTPQFSTSFSDFPLTKESCPAYHKIVSEMKSIKLPSLLNQSLGEILTYARSNEYHDSFQKTCQLDYSLAIVMMQNSMYEEAITIMERPLNCCDATGFTFRDPLLKSRFYMQLGHCYRHLALNDEAFKYYELVLGENVHLSLDEYVGILVGYGNVLEAMDKHKDALYQYIEVSEIYINSLSICSPEECRDMEKCVERVIMRLIPID